MSAESSWSTRRHWPGIKRTSSLPQQPQPNCPSQTHLSPKEVNILSSITVHAAYAQFRHFPRPHPGRRRRLGPRTTCASRRSLASGAPPLSGLCCETSHRDRPERVRGLRPVVGDFCPPPAVSPTRGNTRAVSGQSTCAGLKGAPFPNRPTHSLSRPPPGPVC